MCGWNDVVCNFLRALPKVHSGLVSLIFLPEIGLVWIFVFAFAIQGGIKWIEGICENALVGEQDVP
jgi:hypothetical protein